MLDHVHYEVQQLLLFAAPGQQNDAEQVVRNSLLEQGLVRRRGVIEFLGNGRVIAWQDYVPNWTTAGP
jgi:hypothetical protein